MIEIKNLTKVFKSKNKEKTVALNNVSFNLPDKGMIFITGKSGSGKSTLLNMLGALDSMTSGDILIDGRSLKKLSNNQYSYYRNSEVGFIFQDFKLIENLTIFENINLALKLQQSENKEKILDVLDAVSLKGFESRYPKELSGGQKQRVAIARAIIKNPRLILADEPTGNLDEKTSTQVLELLKKLSKDFLVIVVSHDIIDARKYADRIINLSYGEVESDVIRNASYNNKVSINNGTLYLPINSIITDEEKEFINNNLKENNVSHIEQTDDVFIENTCKKSSKTTQKPFKQNH